MQDELINRESNILEKRIKAAGFGIEKIFEGKEYIRLKEIEEDKEDYFSAVETKKANKKWTSHQDRKKDLGI